MTKQEFSNEMISFFVGWPQFRPPRLTGAEEQDRKEFLRGWYERLKGFSKEEFRLGLEEVSRESGDFAPAMGTVVKACEDVRWNARMRRPDMAKFPPGTPARPVCPKCGHEHHEAHPAVDLAEKFPGLVKIPLTMTGYLLCSTCERVPEPKGFIGEGHRAGTQG